MTRRITAHLTIDYVPLPAEKVFAYREAHRLLHEMAVAWLARKRGEADPGSSYLAEAGSLVEVSPPPQLEALPWAGVTNPLDPPSPLKSQPDSIGLAQTTTGIAG